HDVVADRSQRANLEGPDELACGEPGQGPELCVLAGDPRDLPHLAGCKVNAPDSRVLPDEIVATAGPVRLFDRIEPEPVRTISRPDHSVRDLAAAGEVDHSRHIVRPGGREGHDLR